MVCLLCVDVGLVHPTDFVRTRRCPRPEARAAIAVGPAGVAEGPQPGEAERVLRWVEWNLIAITRVVPMEDIEDLPPSMQPHVVGVPRTWVQRFWHLEKFVVHCGRANRSLP
jgi:hypothetical protein